MTSEALKSRRREGRKGRGWREEKGKGKGRGKGGHSLIFTRIDATAIAYRTYSQAFGLGLELVLCLG